LCWLFLFWIRIRETKTYGNKSNPGNTVRQFTISKCLFPF
jgi:hypothetical protein